MTLGGEGVAAPVVSGAWWAAPVGPRPPGGGGARVWRGRGRTLRQLRLENALTGRLQVLKGLENFPLVGQSLLKLGILKF